jgi:Secretion system C-terminal sorting domain/PKD domain
MRSIILGLLFFITCSASVSAQCPSCTPDSSCVSTDGFPTICPLVPPDGTAGEYYEEQLTFYLPPTVIDPSSGFEATLIDIEVANVSGLPFGLEFTLNDADGVFHPSEGDNYGCATICGTPLLPGSYAIVISVNVLAQVLGFDVNQVQSFTLPLTILPGSGSSGSFSYSNNAGCGSVSVDYSALISVPAPAVTDYSWTFGNGETFTGPTPPSVLYDTPGTYEAVLTTTISKYFLHGMSVSNLDGNWSGDIDDLFGSADPYYQLVDGGGNVVYASSVGDNTTSYNWGDPNFELNNPPYTVQFFDDDDVSAVDALGSFSMNITAGSALFSTGTGTVGTIVIGLDVTSTIIDTATISVFPVPAPTLELNGTQLQLTSAETGSITWFLNGIAIDGQTATNLDVTEGGVYYAEVANSYGCTAFSNQVLYCAPVAIQYDSPAQELFVDDVYSSYQWYYNGLPVDGATSSYLSYQGLGNYAVVVTTDYGCTTQSAVYSILTGVDEEEVASVSVFPNPASTQCTIHSADQPILRLTLHDAAGRLLGEWNPNTSTYVLQLESFSAGVYWLRINDAAKQLMITK